MSEPTVDAADSTPLIEKDPVLVEINKKVLEAFDIFDHESNKTVDVRQVCTRTHVHVYYNMFREGLVIPLLGFGGVLFPNHCAIIN